MIAPLLLLLAAAGVAAPLDQPVYIVPADWHLIEGIAGDGRRVWVSSVVDRAVLELKPGSGVKRVLRLPATIGAPFGIAWDSSRKLLWIAAMCPAEPKIENCGKSGLYAIDDRGKLHRSLTLDVPFNPGDVSVDAQRGRVFVSDSRNGAVYRCEGACKTLQPLIKPNERASAQGLAISEDHGSLIVADYSRGIIEIDLATGAEKRVLTLDGKRLRGMDGLVRLSGANFVGIQNPGNPAELVEFAIEDGVLSDPRNMIGAPPLGEATQILDVGYRLLLVGDAQWRLYAGKDATGPQGQQPTPIFQIVRIPGK